MIDRFFKKYLAYEAIKKAFEEARKEGDKEGMAKAQEDYQAFAAEVEMEGKDFQMLFEAYRVASDYGNSEIHLSKGDAMKAERLVECMRRNGAHYFTYSGSMENVMEFQKAGCHPVEFRMVKGEENCFADKGYNEIPSVLMSVG